MARLVGDLLDVSRVDTGKLRIELLEIDLAAVIHTSVDNCHTSMERRAQKFNLDIPGQALTVSGDAVRLTQVFTNLLDNASKYTPDRGEIGLSVSVADNAVVITVADNGIGIAPEILPNVFEPFIQHVQAIGFNGVGLGIGLTVVRELVEAHGGSVVALSEGSGLGSRFVVTLSLIEPALPEGSTV